MPKGQKNQEKIGLRPIKLHQSDEVHSIKPSTDQIDDSHDSGSEQTERQVNFNSSSKYLEPSEQSSFESDLVSKQEQPPSLDNKPGTAISTQADTAFATGSEPLKNQPLVDKPILASTKIAGNLRMTEKELFWLLKMDKPVLYNLLQILRGSSLDLYTVLYQASEGKGYCQFRQKDLMSQALINNPGTLLKQERWLQNLRLIEKVVQPGSHQGVIYYVYNLNSLPVPPEILTQFADYLKKHSDSKNFEV